MEKPKCRVCNHRHWSNEPHKFAVQEEVQPAGKSTSSGLSKGVVVAGTDSSEVRGKDSSQGDSGDAAVSQQKADTGQVARNRRWRQKHREKYNAYMRQYRRERRKK